MKTVTWKLHLKADPKTVFDLLSTSDGRQKFWAEEATAKDGVIHFIFPNGQTHHGRIIRMVDNQEFCVAYFGSPASFQLEPSKSVGTNLTLVHEQVDHSEFDEVKAGWVSVLLNLKAVADFGCDLRNHDPDRTWDQGYVDN